MAIPTYIYFSISLIGLLGGIFFGNILLFSMLSLVCIVSFLGAILGQIFILQRKGSMLFFLFILGFLGGYVYASVSGNIQENRFNTIRLYEGQYISYASEVVSVYKRETYEDTYVMKSIAVDTKEISGVHHLLRVPKNYEMIVGERISFSGKMYFFEDFNGFAYRDYMLASGIYFSTGATSIVRIGTEQKYLRSYIFTLRNNLIERIYNIFPKQEALFLAGILIGAREDIPRDLEEDFNRSGLTHFIAVSGFNISLCVIFIAFMTKYLPFWIRMISVSSLIVLFTIFVGGGAPVVRAAIMGIIAYYFLHTGNTLKNITLLLFAAVCMSLYSPLVLNYDVSMHLSFLAVLGILMTQGFFTKLFSFVPQTFALREALVLTCSALVFTTPIMVFQFGQFTFLAPLTNVLVAWTIPVAMLLGAITVLLSFLSETLTFLFGYITWIILHYDMQIVRIFGNLDWAVWEYDVGVYKNYFLVLYLIIFGYIAGYFYVKKK